MTSGFQTQVSSNLAPAVAGDRASQNTNLYSVLAGPGALIAGPAGVTVGRFAWLSSNYLDADSAAAIVNSFGGGPVSGFVMREQQGLITTYLADAGMVIPGGMDVTIYNSGDFWVKNDGSTQALVGMKAYADVSTGKASFAATGAPTTTTQTSATITAGTAATFTGSIAGNVLTISSAVVNTLYYGALVGGASVAAGTQIVGLLSGTKGASGSTYSLNIGGQTIAAEAMTATPYIAAGTGGAGIVVGSTIAATASGAATGVVVGGVVTDIITAGTSVVVALPNPGTGTFTTGTITFEQNVETNWYAQSSGAAGELIKISKTSIG